MHNIVKKDGYLFAWIYGKENNHFITFMVNPLRKYVTSRLPDKILVLFSLGLSAALHGLLLCLYRPVKKHKRLRHLRKRLFYYSYLSWLSGFDFRHTHAVVYDHLTAPIAHYISKEDFLSWFERMGCKDVIITHRHGNSWRGYGRVTR
ncbi:MAG: hypothetical protein JXB26_18685 [Candidatus Aminicenantes bacterium]|nr:hypothetical protein [Candidatus Aminicenantes bacterium]